MKRLLSILLALVMLCSCLPAFAESVDEIRQQAEAGDPYYMGWLGYLYYYGGGVDGNSLPQDDDQAFLWFSRGAMAGDPYSMDWLGWLFYEGIGTAQNSGMAARWWEAAAENGNTDSVILLGMLYKLGDGVKQDLSKAEEYFWVALEEESDPWDMEEYLEWDYSDPSDFDALVLDAWDGDVNAMTTLAYTYYFGWETLDRDDLAVYWWQKAAEDGLMLAMFNVAYMYYYGYGTEEDEAEARAWIHRFTLAESLENPSACDVNSYDTIWDLFESAIAEAARPTPTPRPTATAAPANTPGSRNGGRRGGTTQATAAPTSVPTVAPTAAPRGNTPQQNGGSTSWQGGIDPDRPAETMLALGLDELVEAYALGNQDAGYIIAWCFANGEGGLERDDELAFDWWLILAQEGYVKAYIWVADAYYYGIGTAKNAVEAFYWYRLVNGVGDPALTDKVTPAPQTASNPTRTSGAQNTASGIDIDPGRPAEVMEALGLEALVEAYQSGDLDAGYIIAWCFYNGEGGLPMDDERAFEWFLALALEDYVPAFIFVAEAYYYGIGTEEDLDEALYWYQVIAEYEEDGMPEAMDESNGPAPTATAKPHKTRGDIDPAHPAETMRTLGLDELVEAYALGYEDAGYIIAWCFANGQGGLEQDDELAFEWWRSLAEDDEDPRAYIWLADAYFYGVGTEPDPNEALYWYRMILRVGDEELTAKVLPEDEPLAIDLDPGRPAEMMRLYGLDELVELWALGDLDAGYIIAWCFANGEGGLDKDEALAFDWWIALAADEGDPRAYIWVAEAYYYGRGTAVDYDKAIEWYKLLALEGDGKIMNKVGMFYYSGKIVAQDYAEALKWFLMGAEEGDVNAIGNAANMYNYGWGTAQDLPKAFALYKEAAEGGNETVWNNLGVCYINGRGTAKDTAQGAYWITKAAENGNAAAMNNLGQLYEKGIGVQQDSSLAYYWYQKAAEAGNADAQKKLGW